MTLILSTATLGQGQAARLVAAKNINAGPRIFDIIQSYWTNAHLVYGINPVVAIAQACHETGFFTSPWSFTPFNNYCGLGVTGRTQTANPKNGGWFFNPDKQLWIEGLTFANVEAGVLAHCAHLYAYASPTHKDICYNDPRHYTVYPHPNNVKVVADLNGRWAQPGLLYGTSTQTIVDEMGKA